MINRRLKNRRNFILRSLGLLGGLFIISNVYAHHTETHFEDSSSHRIVYQLNKADPEYIHHVLFSAGELLRKYGDDVEVVIAVLGPGIHLLGKHPLRPIPPELQEKARALADYGAAFHACGNTMKSLKWTKKDMQDFARIIPIGVDDIMQLQEQGFTYMSW